MAEVTEHGELEKLRAENRALYDRLKKVIRLTTSAAKRIETVKAIETVRKFGFTTMDANSNTVDVVKILAECLTDLDQAEAVADLIPF